MLNTSQTSLQAQVLNALLILTTIQAQDFQDVDGDRATGRMTLPISYPWASRLSTSLILPAWSLFLSLFWNVGLISSAVLVSLGTYVGAQFYSNIRTPTRDSDTYRIYNVGHAQRRSVRDSEAYHIISGLAQLRSRDSFPVRCLRYDPIYPQHHIDSSNINSSDVRNLSFARRVADEHAYRGVM